jgi:hypothetical protein
MVATHPPPFSGRLMISIARPPGASVSCRVALPSDTVLMIALQNSSTSPSNDPVSFRWAISRCMVQPGLATSGDNPNMSR